MALLLKIAVSLILVPQASTLLHREGTAVQPHWILRPNLRTVFSHVIRCCPQHPFND